MVWNWSGIEGLSCKTTLNLWILDYHARSRLKNRVSLMMTQDYVKFLSKFWTISTIERPMVFQSLSFKNSKSLLVCTINNYFKHPISEKKVEAIGNSECLVRCHLWNSWSIFYYIQQMWLSNNKRCIWPHFTSFADQSSNIPLFLFITSDSPR